MAAGPATRISDLIIPENFTDYIQQETEVKSRLVQSGAIMRSPMLDELLRGGGITFNVRSWQDLDDDADRVSNDTPSFYYTGGANDPDPFKIQTSDEIAVRLNRNADWSEMKLAAQLNGDDPLGAIQRRVANYRMRRMQDVYVAVMNGLFADNDAEPSGTDTHTRGDMTVDISGASYVAGVTDFAAEPAIDAIHTMGDSSDDLAIMMVHSVVYARMRKNNLIDFIPDSRGEIKIARFLGGQVEVIVDDQLPASSGVYHTWFCGIGSMALGMADPPVPVEIERHPGAGNGGGQDVLWNRWQMSMHPVGHAYIGTASQGGPANSVLDDAASWSRVYPERKQIKIARLITREAP